MSNNNFKLFCKELDEILSVRSFSQESEGKLYDNLKQYLKESPPSLEVKTYKKKVVDSLLVDASSYYTIAVLDKDVDATLLGEIINALYSTIIEAYPHLEFEFICNDINNGIAFEQMRSIFKTHVEDLAQQAQTKKEKTIKSLSDLLKLKQNLKKQVIGQDEACEKTVDAIKLIVANIDDFSSLFYVGPTGVGKTKLAKSLGNSYSGNFFKINCGEYASQHDYAKLIGAPPGYVGHSESSLLGEKAETSNAWVFLFDEIENANPKFYDFLLSLLDDGTCTDNLGNTLDFTKSIFIFTTNEGIQANRLGDRLVGFGKEEVTYEDNQDLILKSIKKNFSPEFLNRIDHFIFFNKLKEKELQEVAKLELEHLPVRKTKHLLNYIVKNANHAEYGARNIAKFIKNNIATLIADAILRKQIPLGNARYYNLKIDKGNLSISNIEEDTDGWKNQKVTESS